MLQIKNLTKIYKIGDTKISALNKVNLTVEQGEFVSIMGQSGSGKSTLLHMVAGVDVPDSGSVSINGVNIQKLSPSEQAVFRRHNIGIVYQAFNLVPTLTVEENILLPLALDGKKPKKGELSELLEVLSLKECRKKLPNQLSGGQQQRAAIGRALLSKPSLLLADEPTGNLDSQNAEEVLRLLCEANEKYGQTVLLVTHDVSAGKRAKRQIVMKDGRIIKGSGDFISASLDKAAGGEAI